MLLPLHLVSTGRVALVNIEAAQLIEHQEESRTIKDFGHPTRVEVDKTTSIMFDPDFVVHVTESVQEIMDLLEEAYNDGR